MKRSVHLSTVLLVTSNARMMHVFQMFGCVMVTMIVETIVMNQNLAHLLREAVHRTCSNAAMADVFLMPGDVMEILTALVH